jgi:hypothetical protein
MSVQKAVIVTCDCCGIEQPVTTREVGHDVPLNIRTALLYLWMQGWVQKRKQDYCCLNAECKDAATT